MYSIKNKTNRRDGRKREEEEKVERRGREKSGREGRRGWRETGKERRKEKNKGGSYDKVTNQVLKRNPRYIIGRGAEKD